MSTSEQGGGSGAGHGLTRRRVGKVIAAAAGGAWLLGGSALAQQSPARQPAKRVPDKTPAGSGPAAATPAQAAPNARQPSFLDKLLLKGGSKGWTIRTIVHLDSYQGTIVRTPGTGPAPRPSQPPGAGQPGTGQPYMPEIRPFKFETAALVFPCLAGTAASETDLKEIKGKLTFDNRDVTGQPTVLDNLACGSRYQRWDMRDKEGRQIDFEVELPILCWEVKADEAVGMKAVWPASGRWPQDAQSSFAQQMGAEVGTGIQAALKGWTEGKPPQEVPPWQLAKYLAGRVLELMQPSGDGLVSAQSGLLQGFVLQGAERTLELRRGSEHDIACLLAAVYRAAGLPARIVIGYDVTKTKGDERGLGGRSGSGTLRSWVEFCLYDEPAKASIWVPVDIVRQRRSGNIAPKDRPWRFFGSNDESDDVIPLAFHYHPPTTVVAHGAPCLWGWLTTPQTQPAEQSVRFIVNGAVRKPGQTAPGGR